MSIAETNPAQRPRPTGLKPVLEVIPEHCYQRSTVRGLGIITRDFVLYGLSIWGLLSTDDPLLLIPLWIFSGVTVASLFVIGHDAAHDALFDSKRLNWIFGRLTMLPSWHATELWVFGHNRVHHGHTLKQGFDFVWHPSTVEDYARMGRLRRMRHRFEWGPFGAGAYYFREVFFNKMVRFKAPKRWVRVMRRDRLFVAAFLVLSLVVLMLTSGVLGGIWAWVKIIGIPFLLFCQAIGWVVYVHHIDPETRWWPRREWNRFRGQMEGTTILIGPPGWDFFFHWIMVHVPHHVDMQIPCYRLTEAARAIRGAYPDVVIQRKIRVRDYLTAVRTCKLYDFENGKWLRYSAARSEATIS
ncbi:MAG: fatty acid desaturase [Actinomycetia bacterium]|nr:fatty acid desaturase [Actinomycetes bacterium]MCP4963320.1 fatty acid desaturase [Actinomycetes bacterium]